MPSPSNDLHEAVMAAQDGYIVEALATGGESIKAHPLPPNALPSLKRIYRAMADVLRSGAKVTHEALGKLLTVDDLEVLFAVDWRHFSRLDAADVAALRTTRDVAPKLTAADYARVLEDAYQRRRRESQLLAELEALRAGEPLVPDEEAA